MDRWERLGCLRRFAHLTGHHEPSRLVSVRALARSPTPSARLTLAAVLADPDFPYRAEAARALGERPAASSVDPLLGALDAPEAEVRRAAARSLGRIAAAGLIPPEDAHRLIGALESRYRSEPASIVRAALFLAILDLGGDHAFQTAFRLTAGDPDPILRCEVLRARKYFARLAGTPDALAGAARDAREVVAELAPTEKPRILERARMRARSARLDLHGQCPDLLVEATLGLAALDDPAATRLLGRLATSPSPSVRAAAIRGLGRLGGGTAIRASEAALEDPLWSVRREAIDSLAELGGPEAERALARTLREGRGMDRWHAARTLAHTTLASEALVLAFSDPVVPVREAAEDALLRRARWAELAAEHLEELRREGGTDAQAAQGIRRAEEHLERWSRARAEGEIALVAALAHPERRVRERAARALARSPGGASGARLLAILREGRPGQAELAAFALGLRGEQAARDDLEGAARGDDPELAVAAVHALQDLGSVASLPALRGLSASADSEAVRSAARIAVAMLGRAR